ncbi:MAG: hypothetical protein RLZ75_772 [Pseudomonadota bacterium]
MVSLPRLIAPLAFKTPPLLKLMVRLTPHCELIDDEEPLTGKVYFDCMSKQEPDVIFPIVLNAIVHF